MWSGSVRGESFGVREASGERPGGVQMHPGYLGRYLGRRAGSEGGLGTIIC